MKKKELIIVLIIVAVLVGVILIARNKDNGEGQVQNPQQQVGKAEEKKEEFVEVQADGTKVNTSNQLSKTKTIDGLEISNIRLTEKGNVSQILADVKNPTSSVKGDFPIDIKILDKTGKEIAKIGGYIDKVQPGATAELNASATVDFANAYDFEVSKK